MAWNWTLETAAGDVIRRSEDFESRGDAESWIGEAFGELVTDGVDQVRLFEGENEIYGPMSLHADES